MTEIPEHLLKRSRERRAALGLGGDAPAGEASAETSSPAPAPAAAAATPAPAPAPPVPAEEAKPEPPKPVPAYVQAAERRRKVPWWAMPVLAGLAPWAYVFYSTLEPPPVENDPITLGGEIYDTTAGCAGCHLGSGAGQGATPGFTDLAVIDTWPDFRDQMMWVRLGSEGWPTDTYGATGKTKQGGMPAHESLSDQELAQVVLYERQELSGHDSEVEEPDLVAVATGEKTFAEVGLGELSSEAGIPEDQLESGG